ncbi:MAG: hypothetical protein ABW221_18495 [Vicinamibacteria bacterium]
MIRRHRYAVALVCLAALVVALGLPTAALPLADLGQPIAMVAPPSAAREGVADRSERPSSVVCVRALAPRAPPTA